MLLHNFKYTFKILMRQKMLIFWTFAFPIFLGFFFNMAFSNIEKAENFKAIDIAVIDNDSFRENEYLEPALKELGDKNSEQHIFNITYTNEDEAKKLLEKDKITGYLVCKTEKQDGETDKTDSVKVVISKNGTNQTIFKSAIEEITQISDIIRKKFSGSMPEGELSDMAVPGISEEEMQQQIEAMKTKYINEIQQQRTVNLKDISGKNLSYTVIEFYTLIAMTCLYGGIIGMTAINQSLANTSNNGKRVAMSPAKKGNVVFSSLLAGYVVQVIGIAIFFIFAVLVLKVDFGSQLLLIIPLALTGCLAGLALGIAAGVLVKAGEAAKIGIIIGVTMALSFLSGMMGVTMKYVIDKNAPIINKINPAAMITDGFYSLYYYTTYDRYIMNIASLLIFSAVMIIISWGGLRRQQYDSI